MTNQTKHKKNSYSKWGYIFLIPFFAVFIIFSLIPLINTFYNSFFESYMSGLKKIGPNFVGLKNFATILASDLPKYAGNTVIIWLMGFIPQIVLSLILAVWFTDLRLRLKCTSFFKTIIYMPNLIMAAAFGMLFQMIFARSGPIINTLLQWGWIKTPIDLGDSSSWTHVIIAFLNFLMWFGNTTLLLMAGVMGIDTSIYESALLDGASSGTVFRKITMPLLKPIFVYVFITSMIGGIQLFDIAQIFTKTTGGSQASSYTLMMYLFSLISDKQNYGQAGALSLLMFIVTAALSMTVYRTMHPRPNEAREQATSYRQRMKEYADCPATIAERGRNAMSASTEKGVR